MRRFCLPLLLTLLSVLPAAAQVVTTQPAFPTENDPVTILFDATEGTGGLAGYTGDVYAHTGVITATSTSPSDWKYVKTQWGQNTPETRLVRVPGEPDRYTITIGDIRAYYGVPQGEAIERLAFVFRSADTSREGKAEGGADIFVDLYEPGVNVAFAAPETGPLRPLIAERDTTVEVVAVAQAGPGQTLTSLRLFVEGAEVAQTADDTLRYDLVLDAPGRLDVYVVAENDAAARDTAAFYAVRNPTVVDEARPVADDGVNYQSDTDARVILSLFAPGKDYVYVLGDFNGWEVDPAYFMKRDAVTPDSVHYWLQVDGLVPGEPYAFQYLVDGEIRVADPYSELVLDPFNDGFLSAETFPDLPAYPAGKTELPVGVLETGQDAPAFEPFERPAPEELVIYELLLRDFVADHDFETLRDTLDYLDRLGINAIELMPVSEFDGNESWGYNPAFHLALDKYYGPPETFKRLVDEAHRRGIAVILDVVYNHATGQSPLIRLYNEGTFGRPTPENPYANVTARHPFNVFNDLNHESTATRYWLDRANRYWLEEYNVDGFRFDLSKGFTQRTTSDVGAWGAYDAGRVATLKRMADQIWAADPGAYIILEHFGGRQEEEELSGYRTDEGRPGMLFWLNMNRAYSQSAMGYLSDNSFSSDLRAAHYEAIGLPRAHWIAYMESHDEQWLMYRNLAYGNRFGSYDIQDLPTALDRMKLVGAFFFPIPGPKMMWQFGELGYGYGESGEQCLRDGGGGGECPSGAPGRVAPKPIRWDYRADVLREKLYKTWAALINLRMEHEVFRSLETDVSLNVGQGTVVRTVVLEHPTMSALIVGNFGVTEQTWAPSFPEGAGDPWYEFFSGETRSPGQDDTVVLLPGELRLYTSQDVGTAEPGLITVADEGAAGLPGRFALHANYPNPFNPTTAIPYDVPRAGPVEVAVYDALGRRVALLADGVHAAGAYTARFEAGALPSGAYFVRLRAEGRTLTRTAVLVK